MAPIQPPETPPSPPAMNPRNIRMACGPSLEFDRPPASPRPAPIAAPTRQKAAIAWFFSFASARPSVSEPRNRGLLFAAASGSPGEATTSGRTTPCRRISAANQPPNAIQPQRIAPR